MKRTLLFRVDGGKIWGTSMGHIRRAILLAAKLKDKYEVIFVMKNYSDGIRFVKKRGITVSIINVDDNTDQVVIDLCEKFNPDMIIMDLAVCPYSRLFEYARIKNIKAIVFDIAGKFLADADILINDSFVDEFTLYPGISNRTSKYLGPKYFIIEETGLVIPPLKRVTDIMITFGGSDPAGLTVKLVCSLPEIFSKFKVNIVLGPLFTEKDEIRQAVGERKCMFVHDNPAHFLRLLSRQDLVITAAGRTLYECAFFGKTVITVPSIEHEAITSREYAILTGSIDIGLWKDGKSPAQLAEALELYQSNPVIRQRIYEKSRQLVDGQGLNRVLEIIN